MGTVLKSGYASIAEADNFLTDEVLWKLASDIKKSEALQFGRYFIDSYYSCPYIDENDPSESVKYANSLYALDYLNGNLFDTTTPADIKKEMVKAGSVETETEYNESSRVLKNEKAQILLSDECTYFGEGSISGSSTVPLVRR